MLIERISLTFNKALPYKSKNYTYQNILLDTTQQLANFIVGKKQDLQLCVPAIKIQRNDPLELRERIRNMSSTERKRVGINKSTLWYQKNQLAKGKNIKFYGKVLSRLE